MERKILILASILLGFYGAFTFAQGIQDPCPFRFKSIPFGEPLERILGRIEGSKVNLGDANIGEMEHYGVKDCLKGGFYYIGRVPYLNPEIVKHFVLTDPRWETMKEIHLYFSRKWDEAVNPYTLFFVKKILSPQCEHYKNHFDKLQRRISNELEADPATWETRFQDPHMKLQGSSYPALIGQWTLLNKKVFLLVHGSKRMTTAPPEILYLCCKERDKYLQSCKRFEMEKRKKF